MIPPTPPTKCIRSISDLSTQATAGTPLVQLPKAASAKIKTLGTYI